MASLGTLTVILGVDISELAKAQTAMNTLAQRMRTIGYLTSVTLTAPIVAAGKSAFSAAKEYEYAMQKIVGLTGTAQSEVNQWSDEIKGMAKEFGKMPLELGEALYFIASSGIHGAEALEVLRVSAMGSAAGLGETQKVADLVTSALNAYAGTGLTAAQVMDILTAAVREGKAEADGFARSMGQVIPIASELGVSFDEVAGGMAAITLSGASAANAAVWLKGIFNTLLTASPEGAKALEKVNSSYTKLREILEVDGLIALMEEFRRIQSLIGDEAMKDVLPNLRGLQGYLSIAGKNFEYNSELMQRVTNSTGALGKAFEAISNTMKLKLDQALVTIKISAIDFGKSLAETLIPMIEKLAKWIEGITKAFNSLTDGQRRFIIILGLLAAALGPVLLILSSMIYVFGALKMVVPIVIAMFRTLMAAVMANPLLAMVTLMGAWIIHLIGVAKRTKEAAAEQKEYNKALEEQGRIMEEQKSIDEMMSMYKNLNERQLTNLISRVKQQIEVEEDALVKLVAEYKKDLELMPTIAEEFTKTATQEANNRINDLLKNIKLLEAALARLKSGGGKDKGAYSPLAFRAYSSAMGADIRTKRMAIDAMGLGMSGNKTGGWQPDFEREKREEDAARALRTQMTLVTELTNLFEGMFSSVEEGFAGMARAAISAIKQIATEILARMAVWFIFKMLFPQSAAFEQMGKLGQFAFAHMGRGMASGGIVPPGYPNDTYPARLTSGEAVIPAGMLNQLGSATSTVNVIVDGKISGRDLALVMRRMNVSN